VVSALNCIAIPGDHDGCDPSLSEEMHNKIAGSKLVILLKSGHMTFVDQPGMFIEAVKGFLYPAFSRGRHFGLAR